MFRLEVSLNYVTMCRILFSNLCTLGFHSILEGSTAQSVGLSPHTVNFSVPLCCLSSSGKPFYESLKMIYFDLVSNDHSTSVASISEERCYGIYSALSLLSCCFLCTKSNSFPISHYRAYVCLYLPGLSSSTSS